MSDLNVNMAQCLRDVTHLGYTRIFNACNGTHYDLPWGLGSWLGIIAAALIPTLAVAFYVWLEYPIWKLKRKHAAERASWGKKP